MLFFVKKLRCFSFVNKSTILCHTYLLDCRPLRRLPSSLRPPPLFMAPETFTTLRLAFFSLYQNNKNSRYCCTPYTKYSAAEKKSFLNILVTTFNDDSVINSISCVLNVQVLHFSFHLVSIIVWSH